MTFEKLQNAIIKMTKGKTFALICLSTFPSNVISPNALHQ